MATYKDQIELNQISLTSKEYWGYPKQWIEKWSEDLSLSRSDFEDMHILVGEMADEIVGFCGILNHDSHFEIMHLWLLPAFIGKGYGKKLLQQALLEFIKEQKPIHVTADPNAENFYRKQGFEVFKEVESYPKGRFLPVMKRDHLI